VAAAGETIGAPPASEALRAAHAQVLRDPTLQFDLKAMPPPPKPMEWPKWLQWLFDRIGDTGKAVGDAIFPVLQVVFWAGVALLVALVVFLIVREFWGVRWARRKRARPPRQRPADWRPEAWKARALLEDADRLAAAGAYDEAVHLILYRSIDDIEGRRPRLVRPALTARDIARQDQVPGAAREAFGQIARVVESSFFGGRPVGQGDFAEARAAYEAFAFPEAWA
jgi:hypothetical protein